MKAYQHISARIICDSIHPNGSRLTTFELTYPRYIHAEIMTHRVISRNAQSSRAIPVKKRLENVRNNPVTPIRWGANQAGMQAKDVEVTDPDRCRRAWEEAANEASQSAELLMDMGLHKQWANRLLEPFDTITVVATGTKWENLFGLRCHPDAQPEFQCLAWMMADLYYWHQADVFGWDVTARTPGLEAPTKPQHLHEGDWHLPYFGINWENATPEPHQIMDMVKCSVARCARVSYLNHDKTNPDPDKDIALHDRLLEDGHMSPFEHQARAIDSNRPTYGNFEPGWEQYRKILPRPEVRTFNYAAAMKQRV